MYLLGIQLYLNNSLIHPFIVHISSHLFYHYIFIQLDSFKTHLKRIDFEIEGDIQFWVGVGAERAVATFQGGCKVLLP